MCIRDRYGGGARATELRSEGARLPRCSVIVGLVDDDEAVRVHEALGGEMCIRDSLKAYNVSAVSLVTVIACLLIMAGLMWFTGKTKMGKAMRCLLYTSRCV